MVPFTTDTPGYLKDPKLRDKIHCVAFVIDGSTIDAIPDTIHKQFKDLQVRINHRSKIYMFVKLDTYQHLNKYEFLYCEVAPTLCNWLVEEVKSR
jgi:hypothetical protein